MKSKIVSERQRQLFKLLENCGELIFAGGHNGINANICGEFHIQGYDDEDRLEVGDGTHHIHIQWDKVKRFEIGKYNGEGVITFFDGDTRLFKLYRPEGEFPENIRKLSGNLV